MSDVPFDTTTPPARGLSVALSAMCALLAVGLPAATLYVLILHPAMLTAELGLSALPQGAAAELTVPDRLWTLMLGFAPIACVSYALICAQRCFRSFVRGAYFTLEVVRSLRHFAGAVALAAVTGSLMAPLLTWLLTLDAEPGHELAALGGQSCYLLMLLFAGIVWQIADAMTKAVVLAEENSQFV